MRLLGKVISSPFLDEITNSSAGVSNMIIHVLKLRARVRIT
jgi:hypothetical protein